MLLNSTNSTNIKSTEPIEIISETVAISSAVQLEPIKLFASKFEIFKFGEGKVRINDRDQIKRESVPGYFRRISD